MNDTDKDAMARVEAAQRRRQAFDALPAARETAHEHGLLIDFVGDEALYYVIKTPVGDIDWNPARQMLDASDVPQELNDALMRHSPDQPKTLLAAVQHVICGLSLMRSKPSSSTPASSLFGESGGPSAMIGGA